MVAVGAAMLWVGAVRAGSAFGQDTQTRLNQPYRGPATISVATLRVPDKAWKLYEKAAKLVKEHRSAEAEPELIKALQAAPEFAEAHLLLASVQLLQHRYDEVIAHVRTARGINPDLMWADVTIAGAYNGLGRYADARAVLAASITAEAATWQAAMERARAEVGLRNIEAALYWSGMALEAAPAGYVEIRLVRSNALVIAGRWREAAVELESYLASQGPQVHHAEVVAALDQVRLRIQDSAVTTVASK